MQTVMIVGLLTFFGATMCGMSAAWIVDGRLSPVALVPLIAGLMIGVGLTRL